MSDRTRRANGTGSIGVRADGAHIVRATDPNTGRRVKRIVHRGMHPDGRSETPSQHRSRAERALTELRRQLAEPASLRERWTVERYARERYLPSVHERTKPRTFESYANEMRLFVFPYVGDIELSKLSVDDVDAMDRMLTAKGYSLAVRRKARGCLNRVMRHAVAKRRVAHNPCADADRLAADHRDRTKGSLDPEQVRALLAAARGSDWECAISLLGLLGLRRGEVLGLSWQSVDLDAGTITVSRSMATLRGGRLVLGTPKTSASRRTLSLSTPLFASLRAHRARQAEMRLSAGKAWVDSFTDDRGESVQLCFTDEIGRPLPPHGLNDALNRIAATVGVKCTPHLLRHSAASLMFANGVDIATVSGVLGHASPAVTLSVYSHALGRNVARATEAIASAVGEW
jgi:integrase